METHFKVLVSSNIRRKKPWSRLAWIGNVKESVCLMDRHRASILYLPSGHTKRVIDVFKPHKKNIVCINTSSSGEYLVACLASGDILHWHKDTNASTIIPACPNFRWLSGKSTGHVSLFVSDDGRRIVSIVENHKVDVWEQVGDIVEGEWTRVGIDTRLLTALARKETAIDAVFFSNQIQGSSFLCSFTFSDSVNANLCFLHLRWSDDPKPTPNAPTFVTSFSRLTYPLKKLHPSCQPLRVRGCYVSRLSHDGRMMALAINQLQPYLSCMLFVNVYQQSAIATSQQHVYNDKIKALPSLAKTYWTKMLTWSSDDLFLFCITRRGSLLLYNNAGEPMMGTTHGLGVELGLSYLLPIHPLVEPMRNAKKDDKPLVGRPSSPLSMASTLDSEKSLKQKYSVTAHPSLPIVLCSDGYMVTALQMTNVVTSHDIAALSLVETNQKMKMIIDKFSLNVECIPTPRYGETIPVQDEAKFKEYKYTRLYLYIKNMFKRKKDSKEAFPDETNQTNDDTFNALVYEFEKAEKEDDVDFEPDSTDDMKKPTGVVEGADEGRITFGDYNSPRDDQLPDENAEEMREDGETLLGHIRDCVGKLLHSFALLLIEQSSYTNSRHVENAQIVDKLHLYFIETLKNLCQLLVTAQETSRCLPWKLTDDCEDVGDLDYRHLFNDLMNDLSTKVVFVTRFNTGSAMLVLKAVEAVAGSTLRLCSEAAEGCSSMHDLHHNLAAVLHVLIQAERNLARTSRFHKSMTSLEFAPDSLHLHDVVNRTEDHLDPHHSGHIWKKFHAYLSNLYTALPNHQDLSSFDKLLSAVQWQLTDTVMIESPEVVNLPLTLFNMSNNLMKYQLDAALHLASFVLHDHLNVKSKWSENDWKAVELLCLVMDQYFCKKALSFPSPIKPSGRRIVLHRDIITEVVSIQRLPRLWNANQCVKMLLLCGRLQDASRLADCVGSWKVAVSIGAAVEKVRAFKPNNEASVVDPLLKERFKSLLPPWIILDAPRDDEDNECNHRDQSNEDLFDYHPESSAAPLVDLFLAGVMTGYDIAGWGATELLSSLKRSCRSLSLLEGDDIYLPSPPLYLPQPTPNDGTQRCNVVLRHKISILLRLTLIVFHSVGAMQDLLLWYTEKLRNETSQPGSNQSQCSSDNHVIVRQTGVLAAIFRDVCAILWMLHVREKLTLAVRKFQELRARGDPVSDIIEECLLWTSQMRPFAKYLACEVDLESLVLCLCSEKVVDRRLVSLLAYYFCDDESVSPKLHSRLAVVLRRLRQTMMPPKITRSPRDPHADIPGQPYSILYQKQCRFMLQKQMSDVTLQHVFVTRSTDQSIDYEFCPSVSSLKPSFFFECDSAYQYFIGKLFDVISAKSSAMNRAVQREGASKWPDKILVGANRHAIAVEELDKALAYMQQQKYTSLHDEGNNSHLGISPTHSSTPKHNPASKHSDKLSTESNRRIKDQKCAHSCMTETLALNHYFSDQPITDLQRSDADDVVQSIVGRIESCMNFDISDVPPAMRKRFCRLLPYITWLHFWMQKENESKSVMLKPSIHVVVSRQDLMQSMCIAEVRFGGYSEAALNEVPSTRSSSVTTLPQADIPPPASPTHEDQVKEQNVEELEEEKILVKNRLSTLEEEVSSLEEEVSEGETDSDTVDEVADISETVVKESTEDVDVNETDTEPKEIETDSETVDDRQTDDEVTDISETVVKESTEDVDVNETDTEPKEIETDSETVDDRQTDDEVTDISETVVKELKEDVDVNEAKYKPKEIADVTLHLTALQNEGEQETDSETVDDRQTDDKVTDISEIVVKESTEDVDVNETDTEPKEIETDSETVDDRQTDDEVADISETVVKELKEDVDVKEAKYKPKEIADVTLHLTALQNEGEQEESLSELADGGSSRKPRGRSPPSSRRDNNLGSVVRDEIHNVLLAQQVSLLSQILLGQTMTGGGRGVAQMSDVADMLKNMQGTKAQSTSTGRQQFKSGTAHSVETDKENTQPEAGNLTFIEAPVLSQSAPRRGRSRKKKNDELGITLFHVPGITNSQQPKEVTLVRTPKSKQAWAASSIARDKSTSPVRHFSPRLLRPQRITHNQAAYVSSQPTSSAPQPCSSIPPARFQIASKVAPPFNPLPSYVAPPPSYVAPPPSSPYKTAFPILTRPAPAFVPVRPVFQEQPHASVHREGIPPQEKLFTQLPTTARAGSASMQQPPTQRHFRASFIDPREVIAYHTKKQAFSSVKHTSSAFRTIKPLPVLQLPTPLPPKEVRIQQPSPTPEPEKHVDPPTRIVKKFEGYLNQKEINDEVLHMVNQLSDSAEKLSQANVHLLAAVAKKTTPKPRMVDAGLQVVEEEEEEEESEPDYREKMTTKPLPPPPDIFDRVRKEIFSPSQASKDNEFIHVGEVSIDAVNRGLPLKPLTVAEAHLKAAKLQPSQDMSHVVGFPDATKQDEYPGSSLSKQVKDATKVAEVREVTRDRWTSVMRNMGAQLNAMDSMARHMDDDFKAASRLVDTIDTMQEVISPNMKAQGVSHLPVHPYGPEYPDDRGYMDYPASSDNFSHLPSIKTGAYKKRLEEAYNLAAPELKSTPPHPHTMHPIYEGHQTSPKATMRSVTSPESESTESLEEEEWVSSSMRNGIGMESDTSIGTSPRTSPRAVIHDVATRSAGKGKAWQQRNEREKQKVRDWMRRKQREQSAKYRTELRSLKEAEVHPFQPPRVEPKSTRSLKMAADKRKAKQRAMLSSHMTARLDDSVQLMEELQDDTAFNKKTLRSPLHDVNGRHVTPMKKPTHRKTPYSKQTRHSTPPLIHSVRSSDNFDNVSNSSVLSSWSLNDDVKRLLYGKAAPRRRSKVKGQVTFDLSSQTFDGRSSDVHSRGTASLLDEMDWQAVDALVASLDSEL